MGCYPKQNGLAKSLREIGRIEKRFLCSNDFAIGLHRRVQSALNKAENRNTVAHAVFMQRLTQGRGRGRGRDRDTKPGTPAYMKVIVIGMDHYPGPNK